MPSILSANDITKFQNAVNNHFDTFKRTIVVHKEPIKKIISNVNNGQTLGYEENSIVQKIEYIPRNQQFEAIINYNTARQKLGRENEDIKLFISSNTVGLKVKPEARDYIMNDKTEKITFDGKSYNLLSKDIVKNYFGLIYYTFYVEETK
jgi:hypothetical protein